MEIANDSRLKIGELARQTGLSIKTIRYYGQRADTVSTVQKRSPGYGSSRGRSCSV
jgi:predicted transcriptional regulator